MLVTGSMVIGIFTIFPLLNLYGWDTVIDMHKDVIRILFGFDFGARPNGIGSTFFLNYLTTFVPIAICLTVVFGAWGIRGILTVFRRPIIAVHAFITQQGELGAQAADRTVALTLAIFAALFLLWAHT